MRLKRQAVQRQNNQRLALARLCLGLGVGRAPAEHPQGEAVQVLEQLALPGVPNLGAGATDIGHGQQVERGQPPLGAHALGKAGNHVGVAQV